MYSYLIYGFKSSKGVLFTHGALYNFSLHVWPRGHLYIKSTILPICDSLNSWQCS